MFGVNGIEAERTSLTDPSEPGGDWDKAKSVNCGNVPHSWHRVLENHYLSSAATPQVRFEPNLADAANSIDVSFADVCMTPWVIGVNLST